MTQVRLVDEPDRSGRTTATLLASLSGRLAVLHAISGADAIAALVAGFAALGRDVARTAEGKRLKAALERGPSAAAGERLWTSLLIERWTSPMPPSPVLDHLRNDLALLLADDIDQTLALPPVPYEPVGSTIAAQPHQTTWVEFALGLWAFSGEAVAGIEALAAAAPDANPEEDPVPADSTTGPILR